MRYTDEYEFYSNLINNNSHNNIKWNKETELLIINWCEISGCYSLLSYNSYKLYCYYYYITTLPIILLSLLVTILSFIQFTNEKIKNNDTINVLIGLTNSLVGFIIILQTYFKITDIKEEYKISFLNWDKLSRAIRLELIKEINERMDAKTFLQINRHEYERLIEITPVINKTLLINSLNKINQIDKNNHIDKDIYNYILSSNTHKEKWNKEISLLNIFYNFNDYDNEELKKIKKNEKKYNQNNHDNNTNEQIKMNEEYILFKENELIIKNHEKNEIKNKFKSFKNEINENKNRLINKKNEIEKNKKEIELKNKINWDKIIEKNKNELIENNTKILNKATKEQLNIMEKQNI